MNRMLCFINQVSSVIRPKYINIREVLRLLSAVTILMNTSHKAKV